MERHEIMKIVEKYKEFKLRIVLLVISAIIGPCSMCAPAYAGAPMYTYFAPLCTDGSPLTCATMENSFLIGQNYKIQSSDIADGAVGSDALDLSVSPSGDESIGNTTSSKGAFTKICVDDTPGSPWSQPACSSISDGGSYIENALDIFGTTLGAGVLNINEDKFSVTSAGLMTVDGVSTFNSAVTISSDLTVTNDLAVTGDSAITGNETVGGTSTITGAIDGSSTAHLVDDLSTDDMICAGTTASACQTLSAVFPDAITAPGGVMMGPASTEVGDFKGWTPALMSRIYNGSTYDAVAGGSSFQIEITDIFVSGGGSRILFIKCMLSSPVSWYGANTSASVGFTEHWGDVAYIYIAAVGTALKDAANDKFMCTVFYE